jgi:hypothetical protein
MARKKSSGKSKKKKNFFKRVGRKYVDLERDIVTEPNSDYFLYAWIILSVIISLVTLATTKDEKPDSNGDMQRDYSKDLVRVIFIWFGVGIFLAIGYVSMSLEAGRFEAECGERPGKRASKKRVREYKACVGRLQGQNRLLAAVESGNRNREGGGRDGFDMARKARRAFN